MSECAFLQNNKIRHSWELLVSCCRIICPENASSSYIPTLWAIMSKVRLEAFLWGAGTALGELPPYFMAKAARLSGYDPEDDDDLKEFEELKKKRDQGERLSPLDRAKVAMEKIVERIGFLGILACASVSVVGVLVEWTVNA